MKNRLLLIFLGLVQLSYSQDLEGLKGKKKDLVKLNGSISLGTWYYRVSGIENRRTPFSWYITGAPTLSIGSFALPFSATISEQERSFQQPFNQMGVSPYYKWLKLHLGYRNMMFSDYTLSGVTFLGAGIELNPGKLRAGFFYGRLRREVNEDTSNAFAFLPSYKRMAMGAKLGLGSAYNFLEFNLLQSRDILNSATISSNSLVKPEDNLVLGAKNQWRLFKAFTVGADGALSVITYNKNLGNISLDSLGPDVARLAVLNNYLFINTSTLAKLAGNAFAAIQANQWGLRFTMRYVEPDFTSHGVYFIQDDLLQYTVNPSFSMFKQRVNINLNGGWQRDNLDNKKRATTERAIGSASISLKPLKRMYLLLSYANYGTSQNSGQIQINDSIRTSLVNTSYNGSIGYQIPAKRSSHQLVLSIQKNDVLDRNEFTSKYSQSNILFTNFNYSIGFNKIRTNISFGLNQSMVNTYGNNISSYGVNFGLNKSFFKNRMRLNSQVNYQERAVDEVANGYILSNNNDIQITLWKKHHLGIGVGIIKNTTSVNSIRTFNEQRARINYGFSF
jgi:hypothetical protein